MRKKIISILMLTCIVFIVSCSKKEETAVETSKTGKEVITIGTSAISNDVLEVARDVFNKNNNDYEVEIKVFDNAVLPNTALDEGSIDGNFYQHKPYLDAFNKDKGTDLKTYGKEVFAFQLGLYSDKIKSISEIKDKMKVAIANDASNRALALKLLEKEGIIKLKEGVEIPSILDVTENKHNLEFVEMERLNLAKAIDETDMSVVMADVVLEAGKDSSKALAFAQEDGIFLVIKEDKPWAAELEKALTSQEVKDYMANNSKGTKTPLF